MQRLDSLWRLIATALSFLTFGVGGLLVGVVVYPALMLVRDPSDRRRYGQWVIHQTFRLFIGMMRVLGIYTVETHQIERLNRPGQLVIANHPTLIDVVFLLSYMRHVDCVVKGDLNSNPVMRGPLKSAGYIVNSDPQALLEACVRRLDEGRSLLMFPEGTRSRSGQALRFRRGLAKIAIMAGKDIVPVTIRCRPGMLRKHEPWYRIPRQAPHFVISVEPTIEIAPWMTPDRSENIRSRHLTRTLEHFYTETLNREDARDSDQGADH